MVNTADPKVSTIYTSEYKKTQWKPNTDGFKGAIPRLYIITGKSIYMTWKTAATKSLLPMPFINVSPMFNTDVTLTVYVNHTSYFWPFGRSLLRNFKRMCSMASPTHLVSELPIINTTLN